MSAVRAAAAVDPDPARREAQHILSDRRFRTSGTPRPLRAPLQWLGDRIQHAPVPALWIWIVLGVAALALIAWFVVRRIRRSGARVPAHKNAHGAGEGTEDIEDADELERAADAAERDGDLDRAVRLRFRAGLLRLGDRGAIRYRPSVTTGEVRRTLASPRFDDLAGTFEAVTYGGRSADAPAVDQSRREWPQVLEESTRR